MKAQRHPAKLNPEQATWPAQEPVTPDIEPGENEAAPPAQEPVTPDIEPDKNEAAPSAQQPVTPDIEPGENEAAPPAQQPVTPDIEPGENEAAPPAQEPVTPDYSKEKPPADDLDALVADPWALQKVSRVAAQKIVLACQGGHAERSETGLWCVGLPALTHLGYDRALAGRWLKEAQPHGCDPTLEGGVVVARGGRGWVTVRSTASSPREPMFLAAVREPCPLRCGDEVAVRMAPDGTREVVHGR